MIQDFKLISKKGEGTFSEVLKCQNVTTKDYFACKKMKQLYDSWDHVNNLREIQAMRRLNPHDHILTLHEVIFEPKTGTLCLILELMDMNLYEVIKGRRNFLPESQVKFYAWQLLHGLQHIHNNGIFHRDVKPENILVRDKSLKIADFGSCKSIYSRQPFTEYISTRWYRAPECLLTDGYYNFPMDLWSVGCVLFEIFSLRPLFPGANEVDQLSKIHDILGTPDHNLLKTFKKSRSISFNFAPKKGTGFERMLGNVSHDGINLIRKLLEYDPSKRITSQNALLHAYFREFRNIHTETAPQLSYSNSSTARYYNGIMANTASTSSSSTNNINNHQIKFLKKSRKTSINHIAIDTNKENDVLVNDEISIQKSGLITPEITTNRSIEPLLSNNSNNSSLIINSNRNVKYYSNKSDILYKKKKSQKLIHENSNSKPINNQNSSFLPKLYITNNNPYNSSSGKNPVYHINNNSTVNTSLDNSVNGVFKYSKYYPKNKNMTNVAQIHKRFNFKPAFR